MSTFLELQQKAHQNSVDKGFWEASSDIPTKLMLIVTEIAEAMEEYRSNSPNLYYNKDNKPEGLAIELADATIRVMDLVAWLGYDLQQLVKIKMDYNETREKLHGGKRV